MKATHSRLSTQPRSSQRPTVHLESAPHASSRVQPDTHVLLVSQIRLGSPQSASAAHAPHTPARKTLRPAAGEASSSVVHSGSCGVVFLQLWSTQSLVHSAVQFSV